MTIAVLATTIGAMVVLPSFVRHVEFERSGARVERAALHLAPGAPGDILQQFSNATRAVARRMRPSVVHVSSAHPGEGRQRWEFIGNGSGWVWDTAGHVVTNHHVVDGASRIEVQFHDGAVHEAQLVGSDPLTDIALLKVGGMSLIPTTRHPDFRDVEQGDLVFAFGSPLDFRFSMSSGLVSGMGRSAGIMANRWQDGYEDFIQVDAAINPGNSGGPLTDAQGRVIGMNTAIATRHEGPDGEGRFSGIGLAIPLPMIESVVGQLLKTGDVRKGFLGISVAEPNQPLGQLGGRGAPAGLVVAETIDGLPVGTVIVACNDERVFTSDAFRAACDADDDGTVALSLFDLRSLKMSDRQFNVPATWPTTQTFADANTPFHRFITARGGPTGGVVVTMCQPDSPAATCGLQAGDLILEINDRPIRTSAQLRSTVSSVPPDETIWIKTWRWHASTPEAVRRATLTTHPRDR